MSLYVVITEQCREDAKMHGQENLMKNTAEKVETTQRTAGFDDLIPTAFLKKGFGKGFRLIGYRVPMQDDELIVFLRVFSRGSSEYTHFLKNWRSNDDGLKARCSLPTTAELEKIHADRSSSPPPSPPPKPNVEETHWLYSVFREETKDADELLVLETASWVKKMRSSSMREYLALYHRMLFEIDLNKLSSSQSNKDYNLWWDEQQEFGFAYVYRPDLHRLLLLEPLLNTEAEDRIYETHRKHLEEIGDRAHDLSRLSSRAYPYLMVLEREFWLTIQKDEEANLSLSPEEADLIESIRHVGAKGELGYPLFING